MVDELNGIEITDIPWQVEHAEIQKRIKKAKEFLALDSHNDGLLWLETLASVHYLMFIDYETKNKGVEEIKAVLQQRKPWLPLNLIEEAVKHIENEPGVKINYLEIASA